MQMTEPLQLGARGRPLPGNPVEQRVSDERIRARRWSIIRSASILLLSTVLIALFMVWRRDSIYQQTVMFSLNQPLAELQARVDKLGVLPAALPEGADEKIPYYVNDTDRFYAAHTDVPVIIGSSKLVELLLRRDGYCVVFHDQGRVTARWMTTEELRDSITRQRADMRAFYDERRAQPPQLPD